MNKLISKNKQKEAHYRKYERMILKMAWHFWRRDQEPFDEVFSEGNLVYCESLDKYDETKGSFGTFLYTNLKNHFINWRKSSTIAMDHDIEEFSDERVAERGMFFNTSLNNLSPGAKHIVEKIYNYPMVEEFVFYNNKQATMSQYVVKHHFRKRGWTWPVIWEKFEEIRKMLR